MMNKKVKMIVLIVSLLVIVAILFGVGFVFIRKVKKRKNR